MFTRPTKQEADQSNSLNYNRLNVQTKLEIGQPGDKQEKQADAMADKVMMMPEQQEEEKVAMMPEEEEKVNMMPEEEEKVAMMPEEEEKVSMMPEEEEKVSMMPEEEEKVMKQEDEEKVEMKPEIQSSGNEKAYASSGLANTISSTKGQGQPLPDKTQEDLGNKMGADFSKVTIHTDSAAVQMNQELGAKAFTHGNDIYFNKARYSPDSRDGKRLLAHELTHTMQQGNNVSTKIQTKPGAQAYMSKLYKDNRNKSAGITDDQIKTTVEYKDYIKYWSKRGMDETKALDACRRILQKFDAGIRGRVVNYIASGKEALAGGKGTPVGPSSTPAVAISPNIRGADTPTGAPDRIPPRVDTDANVTISGLSIPMRDITLSIEGARGGNGTATINGNATVDLWNGATTVKLKGVTQTDVGKAGGLKLVAHHGGTKLASSSAFSVAAYPKAVGFKFNTVLSPYYHRGKKYWGAKYDVTFKPDSGTPGDCDKTKISENVIKVSGEGFWTGATSITSDFFTTTRSQSDHHASGAVDAAAMKTKMDAADIPGSKYEVNQFFRVACERSSLAEDKAAGPKVPTSGFKVNRTMSKTGSKYYIHVIKAGFANNSVAAGTVDDSSEKKAEVKD